jgi:hypothetical protein
MYLPANITSLVIKDQITTRQCLIKSVAVATGSGRHRTYYGLVVDFVEDARARRYPYKAYQALAKKEDTPS